MISADGFPHFIPTSIHTVVIESSNIMTGVFTYVHKQQTMYSRRTFFDRCRQDGDDLFFYMVKGEGTCMSYANAGSKQPLMSGKIHVHENWRSERNLHTQSRNYVYRFGKGYHDGCLHGTCINTNSCRVLRTEQRTQYCHYFIFLLVYFQTEGLKDFTALRKRLEVNGDYVKQSKRCMEN